MDTFADQLKHRGRSWSRRLAAMMEVLCWRNTQRLDEMMKRVEAFLVRTQVSLADLKQQTKQVLRRVVNEGVEVLRAHVPITDAGRTCSGGLSDLMHRIISGTTG